ncbi:FAD-dependent oxidoreductase [Bordetella petrii]|nr:FAD-dependent oxidoreductase [Bordetella petrii]
MVRVLSFTGLGRDLGRQPHAASFWSASARERCECPRLAADVDADVAIIGGGFTGLSAAHYVNLAGRSATVLEANQIGWGASGRNGGNAVPRYKPTFPELEARYGREIAICMYRWAHDALDTLEQIIDHHALPCGFVRCGLLTPMTSDKNIARFRSDAEWLRRHVGDNAPCLLDRKETACAVGSEFYAASYLEPRAGAIHPFDYCQSLGNALVRRGVRLFCETPVLDWIEDGKHVRLRTPDGSVRARQLIIATNGYSDLSKAGRHLNKRVVPVASAVISTQVLAPGVRATILPRGQVATDAKRLTNYYRILPDGSLLFGGRGGASSRASPKIYERVRRDMTKIFPQLDGVPIRYAWFGLVAVTLDGLPHIGMLRRNVHYALGYNGRGVALSALLGRELAQRATSDAGESLGPISEGRFAAIPFHALRLPAKQLAIKYMQAVDYLGF